MSLRLVARHPQHGERHVLLESEANVGSAASNHLQLEPPVEPHHARFLYRDGRVIVVDLRSVLGTHIDGRRLDQPTILRLGNLLTIGDWTLHLAPGEDVANPFAGRADRERELLAALQSDPSDDAFRQVYGDWLEENGHRKEAEVLSLEREIRDGEGRIDDAELGRLGYRLRTLAASLPFVWRAAVTRPRIENCHRPDQCPRTWDALAQGRSLVVRQCRRCGEEVHLAETIEIARHHVGQNHRVAVDIALDRYPRDLEVALARLPVTPAPHDGGVTTLPFFSTDEPPGTVGAILSSLNIVPPEELGRGADMGFYTLPDMLSDVAADAVPPSPLIRFLSIHYRWDMYHENPKSRFSEIEHKSYDNFSISFTVDGDLVENWLRTRFGRPRRAIQPASRPGEEGMTYSVYGHWLYYEGNDGGCSLRWESRLPDWALAPTDTNAALRFLHDLARLLGTGRCTYEQLEEFGSRPPPRSGVIVTGPLNRNDFWLKVEPQLGALEVAHALGIDEPIGTSGDVHMSSWSITELHAKSRLGFPRYGNWIIDVHLAGWPSGGEVPNRYAAKHLAPKDRVYSICIRPFEP